MMGVTWLPKELWAPEASPVVAAPAGVPQAEELLWKAIARDREVQVRVLALLEECRREAANGG